MVAKLLLYIIDLLGCIALYVYYPNNMELVIIATLTTVILSVYNMLTIYKGRLSLSTVLLIYTILTQFGLFIPFALIDKNVVSDYSPWTLAFLTSPYLGTALILGNIAVASFDISRILYIINKKGLIDEKIPALNSRQDNKIAKISSYLLGICLLFFLFHILTGGTRLFDTYQNYMNSSAYNSSLYHYILILFYAGTLYLSVTGPILKQKQGWSLWLVIVMIFALNGNKGEFLYSLLAVFGLQGVLGHKINWKIIAAGCLLLFVIIPSITSLRSDGVAGNIHNLSGSVFGAFVEMGFQIRTSVYTLEYMANGVFDYLHGQSYWQPIVNILTPFMEHTIATAKVRLEFPGFGFNQVAESYLNFGLPGVIGFFSMVGGLLCKYENKLKNPLNLAYLGTITCVLINASRNYFVFVPGQILIVTVLYYLIKRKIR